MVIQALVQQGVFRHITKSLSAAGYLVCLVRPAADDDFVICRNAPYGEVPVLPSRPLVDPAADDDFVIVAAVVVVVVVVEVIIIIIVGSSSSIKVFIIIYKTRCILYREC